MSKNKKKPKPAPAPADDPSADQPEVNQILASLSRIDDPVMRYLICMLLDRLTEQISDLVRVKDAHLGGRDQVKTKIN